ncbi:hypothetical protein B0T25DRAFT_452569 [Lasiosphaeria hispida]|uniref:F-box domain-containing protein n=1 Tax=Lasiosphaeria hispida TaxID=260671 RepID=A0AAJ0HLI0_9PEZI|nr:hypothetical protein B0T25DRAFT_452569 [Lasiosphaeria hispida]
MGLSSGGFSDTVRNSISSLAGSHHDRRPRKIEEKDKSAETTEKEFRTPKFEPTKKLLHLLSLPPEVQLLILSQLRFADIERLRRTCKQLRYLATPHQIRILMGPMQLQNELLGHCKSCLAYDEYRQTLLLSSVTDPGYPLASRCVRCALIAGDPRIRFGKKVRLANFETVFVCRWCGWTIAEPSISAYTNEQFHRECYRGYSNALFFYFLLGWVQLSIGITGAALAWRYFRHVTMVFAPTVASFLLLWFCFGVLMFRSNKERTYHWTLFLELTILGLWVPPVYYLAVNIASSPSEPVPKSTAATMAMFALNMLFRLVNAVGNMFMLFKYDMTKRHRPSVRWWRRMIHPVVAFFVFWTYPQALDQKYPPDYI